MNQAKQDDIRFPNITSLTRTEIEFLADRLFARGISSLSTSTSIEREDMILASRILRRLLSAYERGTGHQLHTLLINGDR